LIAATVFIFKIEQSAQIVMQEAADSSDTLIPLCVILQENLKKQNTWYVPIGM